MTSPISRSFRRSVSIHPSKRKFTSSRSRCVLPTRAPMEPVGAGSGRLDGIDNAKTAIAVSVPVEADAGFHLVQHPADVADHRAGAVGRRMADRVADGDARRALLDRRAEELAERLG